MSVKSRPTPQPPAPPIETMAAVLAASGVDLADDAACIQTLIDSGSSSADVHAGLTPAQDRARELRVEAA